MSRKLRLEATVDGTVSESFAALVTTLAFRRWPNPIDAANPAPATGSRYRFRFGSVLREGRVVEVIKPVAITLKEVLYDSPCRVALTMRWRLEPLGSGCTISLRAEYRLNHAAFIRARHWEHRLRAHLGNQFRFLERNRKTRLLQASQPPSSSAKNVI